MLDKLSPKQRNAFALFGGLSVLGWLLATRYGALSLLFGIVAMTVVLTLVAIPARLLHERALRRLESNPELKTETHRVIGTKTLSKPDVIAYDDPTYLLIDDDGRIVPVTCSDDLLRIVCALFDTNDDVDILLDAHIDPVTFRVTHHTGLALTDKKGS